MKLPSRKYVYVLMTWGAGGLPTWVGKVGFSYDADARAADVERSIWQITGAPVRVRVFFRARVFLYRGIEKAIHTVIRRYQSRRFSGASGGTEFFHTLNPVTAVLLSMLYWGYGGQCPGWFGLCVLALPLPLDFTLFVLLLAAVEWLAIALIFYILFLIIPVVISG